MLLLQQELLILHNQQRPTNPSSISVDPDLPLTYVTYHGDFRHDDVHLATQPSQGVHEVLGLLVDAHPTAIHKDLGGTEGGRERGESEEGESEV